MKFLTLFADCSILFLFYLLTLLQPYILCTLVRQVLTRIGQNPTPYPATNTLLHLCQVKSNE